MELNAAKGLADEHVAQLLGYLRATGAEHGLLINFGAPEIPDPQIRHAPLKTSPVPLLRLWRLFAANLRV